jgi:serine/threonine-protein kinase
MWIAVTSLAVVVVVAILWYLLRRLGLRSLKRAAEMRAYRTNLLNATVDGYFLGALLGEGNFAEVFSAFRQDTGEVVAFKILRQEYIDDKVAEVTLRFNNESMLDLRHKNVVAVLGGGKYKWQPYMLLEFVDGSSLRPMLNPRMPVAQALEIFLQACDGLFFMHERGYIHRDLKPENILVSHDGVAKIGDFGFAKQMLAKGKLTRKGTTMGTPAYMSPEHLDAKNADMRSDIYSMGVILFEMLIGRPPFEGENTMVIAAHMMKDPPRITELDPDLPAELADVVDRMLRKDPDERYQTMQAVSQAIRKVADTMVLQPWEGTPISQTPEQIKPFVAVPEAPRKTAPVSVPLDGRPAKSASLASRIFEFMVNGRPVKVILELGTDPGETDWLQLLHDEPAGPNPREVRLRVSVQSPYMARFTSPASDTKEALILMAAGIGLSEVLARDAGAANASYVRDNLNEILRGVPPDPG